jgi:hypothetical protein
VTDTSAHCAFCLRPTDYGTGGDGVRLTIERGDETPASQQIYAHVACLADRLHVNVAFDREMWREDSEAT